MSSSEVGVGYVRLLPSMRGFSAEVRKGLKGPMADIGRESGSAFGDRFIGGLGDFGGRVTSLFTKAFKAAGAAGAVAAGLALHGGLRRVLDTEDATIAFRQMGLGVAEINKVLKGVDRTFDGTPFANPDGFNISAQLLASGRGLEQIEDDLRNIANVTSQTLDKDLARTSETFLKVAATGRVYAQDLNSIAMQGIPIRNILADAIGVSTEALAGMVSEGQITFDVLMDAIGATERFDGAAQSMGSSTRGAFANVRTAVARLGESFLGPLFGENGHMVTSLLAIREGLRSVTPVADRLGQAFAEWLIPTIRDRVIPAFQQIGAVFSSTVVPAFRDAADFVARNRDVFSRLASALGPAAAAITGTSVAVHLLVKAWRLLAAATPVGLVLAVATALTYAWQNSERFRAIVTGAIDAVRSALDPLIARFAGGGGLAGVMERLRDVADRMLAPFREGGAVFDWVASLVADLRPRFESIGQSFARIGAAVGPVIAWIGQRLPGAFERLWSIARPIVRFLVSLIGDTLRLAINGVVQVFQGALQAISGVFEMFAGLFTGDWSRMWEGVKNIGAGIFNAIVGVIKTWLAVSVVRVIGGAFRAIGRLFQSSWSAIRGVFTSAGRSIVSTVRGWIDTVRLRIWQVQDAILGRVRTVWQAIRDAIFTPINWVRGRVEAVFSAIRTFMSTASQTARSLVSGAFTSMRTSVVNTIGNLLARVRQIPGDIIRGLGNVGRLLYDSGRRIIQGLIDGIKSMVSRVTGAMGDVLKAARRMLPSSPAKDGPFSGRGWTLYSGRSIADALAEGLDQRARAVVRAAEGLLAPVQASLDVPSLSIPPLALPRGTATLATDSDPELLDLLRQLVKLTREGKVMVLDGEVVTELVDRRLATL